MGMQSIESHVGNHLVADVFVEAADDVLTLHGEFHAEGGIGEVDEKRLVADVEGGGVGGNGLAHDVRPGVDEALLEKGRLEALIPEVLEDNVLDEGAIAFEHTYSFISPASTWKIL